MSCRRKWTSRERQIEEREQASQQADTDKSPPPLATRLMRASVFDAILSTVDGMRLEIPGHTIVLDNLTPLNPAAHFADHYPWIAHESSDFQDEKSLHSVILIVEDLSSNPCTALRTAECSSSVLRTFIRSGCQG